MQLTDDLGAVRTLGAHLAFEDAEWLEISGQTLDGDHVTRSVQVCGHSAFVVLKASVGESRLRHVLEFDIAATGCTTVRHEDFWGRFQDAPERLSERMIVVADFAELVRFFAVRPYTNGRRPYACPSPCS
jgi:hypothetical protein